MPFDQQLENDIAAQKIDPASKLYCASCSSMITSTDWKYIIKDGFEHTVFNPAGIVFHIGCFKEAPGCWATGQPSSEFTWFKGYDWRLALCQNCGKHLGWLFTSPNSSDAFFGLILNRLKNQADL